MNSEKIIWFLVNSYLPRTDAEANRIISFSSSFKQANYKVYIVANGESDCFESSNGLNVFRVANKYANKPGFKNRLLKCWTYTKKCKKILGRQRKQIKGHIVLATSPELLTCWTILKAKRLGAKTIFDVRDIWPEVAIEMKSISKHSLAAAVFRFVSNTLYKKADMVITVSKYKEKYLKEFKKGKFANKIKLIPNGFDTELLSLEPDTDFYNSLNIKSKCVVSYVGKVGKAQRTENLIRSAIELRERDITFVIVGDGVELEKCKAIAEENKLTNVIFTGRVNPSQAKAVTTNSTFSYVSLKEDSMINSVPTKLFESLGLGVPVLLVSNGESREILDESHFGYGLLPSEADEKLTSVLEMMVENVNNLYTNKETCQNYIINYWSRSGSANKLIKILEEQKYV